MTWHRAPVQYSYPILSSEADSDAVRHLAKSLDPDSVVVEIGSCLGGSAKLMMDSNNTIRKLYCLDEGWKTGLSTGLPMMDLLREPWQLDRYPTTYEFAKHYLSTDPRIQMIPCDSPYEVQWWSEMVDMVYEDSSHNNPQLRDNLQFWYQWLKPGGLYAGHDYGPNYPEVLAEVNALAERTGGDLHVHGAVWWMLKPKDL